MITKQVPDNYVPIHLVFEQAVNSLSKLTPYEQSIISQNIVSLNYIDELFDRNPATISNNILNLMAESIKNKTFPVVDIMTLSAFVYKGKERGLNVQPLIEAMNQQGGWLMKEAIKTITNKK